MRTILWLWPVTSTDIRDWVTHCVHSTVCSTVWIICMSVCLKQWFSSKGCPLRSEGFLSGIDVGQQFDISAVSSYSSPPAWIIRFWTYWPDRIYCKCVQNDWAYMNAGERTWSAITGCTENWISRLTHKHEVIVNNIPFCQQVCISLSPYCRAIIQWHRHHLLNQVPDPSSVHVMVTIDGVLVRFNRKCLLFQM